MIKKIHLPDIVFGAVILVSLIFFLLGGVTSCGGVPVNSISINIAPPGDVSPGSAEFDVNRSTVIRCADYEVREAQIQITSSKAMDMKASTLIFALPQTDGSNNYRVAAVPVNGQESEYDLSKAIYYTVTGTSIKNTLSDYGIPYDTWYSGVCSGLDKFSCCE